MTRRLSLLLLALLPSCSIALIDGPHNRCTTDLDCLTGTCDTVARMCVGTPPAPLTVGLGIAVPSTGASVGAVYPFAPFAVPGPLTKDLAAPRPITVAGAVRQPGRDGSIPADVVFTPDETIPGRSGTVVRVSTTEVPTAVDPVAVADFVAQLTGATHYSVRIEPTGAARAELPPLVVSDPRDAADQPLVGYASIDAAAVEADFAYPAMLDTLQGDLVNAAGDPLPGLTVQAVDAATGEVVSSSPTSAPVSDPRPGSFTLTFAPNVMRWLLRVSAPSSSGVGSMPVPTFTVDPTRIFPSGSRARILVPSPMPIAYTARVARADTGDWVQGATVLLQSSVIDDPLTGVSGTFRAAPTMTNELGIFEVTLVPGSYQLVVIPGSGSDDLAVTVVERIDLTHAVSPVMGALFEVPTRATFGGTVTVDGHSMSGTTVQATSLGRGADPASAYARSPSATTDPSGLFAMSLDVGTYDVVAEPPSGAGYAWTAYTDVAIDSTGIPNYEITLEAPVPLSGTLRDAMGMPIVGAEIRAFGVIQTPEPGTRRSVAIGRVTTDATGHYSLLLPPSL